MNSLPALIPAAGKGTRLRPITRYLSKPMLPVGSEPIIHFSVEEALEAGCNPIVVIRGSGDDDLERYLEKTYGNRVLTAVQPRARGLADALKNGYHELDSPERCAMLLPDNVVLEGRGIGTLIQAETEETIIGTIEITQEEAEYFGNSGDFQSREPESGESFEKITELQKKGSGNFQQRYDDWPARRTVGRSLLRKDFFERAKKREPDPETGEIDDVPILRAMIQSSDVYAVPLEGELYDTGTPDRYLRLSRTIFDRTRT